MNSNQRTYTISNEQLLLIDILNTMYNDNLRQITNLTDSNQQIRNLIIQILNTNGTPNCTVEKVPAGPPKNAAGTT